MNPKVSVIVPIYGVEKYLRQCVDSILAQTLKEIEVILVDDGSPDGCPAIVDEYAAKDSRVVAVHQENSGVSNARNTAMKTAKGDYVAFIDPDDIYATETALEDLHHAAKSNSCDIAGGKVKLFKNGDDPWEDSWAIHLFTNFPHYGVVGYEEFQSLNNFGCYIYSREFLERENIYFPPLMQFEDPVFFVRAMIAARMFAAVDEVVYFYRQGVHLENHIGKDVRRLNDRVRGQLAVFKLAEENGLARLAGIAAEYFLTSVKIQNRSAYKIESGLVNDFTEAVMGSKLLPFGAKCRFKRRLGLGLPGIWTKVVGMIKKVR